MEWTYVSRIAPIVAAVLCMFASTALFVEGGAAEEVSASPDIETLYAAAGTSANGGHSRLRKKPQKRRPVSKPGHQVSGKKKSHAGVSHKKVHSKARKPAPKQMVGIFTVYTRHVNGRKAKRHLTADETDVRTSTTCIVANNKLKLGTRVRIEGIGTCEVHDRIGKRAAANLFDIFTDGDHKSAKAFGRKKLKYTVEGT